MQPTECKWCGCGDIEDQSSCMQSVIVTFACGSMSDVEISETRWLRDSRCAGQVGDLYKRIQRAVEVLETAVRRDFIIGYSSYMEKRSDGEFMEYEQAVQAIEILKGGDNGQTD